MMGTVEALAVRFAGRADRVPHVLLILSVAAVLGCSTRSLISWAPLASPSGPATGPPVRSTSTSTGAARWVPRIAPAPLEPARTRMTAPIRNNFGTAATTYLGHGRAGLLHGGRRFLWQNEALAPLDTGDSPGLDAVVAVPPGLGGGFVFSGEHGVASADTFGGPLRKLTDHPTSFVVAPQAVLVFDANAGRFRSVFLSTKDGKELSGAPHEVERLFTNRNGLALATSTAASKCWFTADGRVWKELALRDVRLAGEDGDGLLVFTEGKQFHLGEDGRLIPAHLSPDEELTRRGSAQLAQMMPSSVTGAEDVFEGSLFDTGWAPTGRSDDEWFQVQDRHVCTFRTSTGVRACSPGTVGREDEYCGATMLPGGPFIGCFSLGTRLSVFHVDLATGGTSLERTIEVKAGFARHIGSVAGTFPITQMVAASCEGDARNGICVRDAQGNWRTFGSPPQAATVLPFPGELVILSRSPEGHVVVESAGTSSRRVFAADEVSRVDRAMGVGEADASIHEPPVVQLGALRTATGIRQFFGPNPSLPVTRAESYAVDFPLTEPGPLTVRRVSGAIAQAGLRALRLYGGKLWETSDGWLTWYEVAPPPTGVPADLGGAMCDERGCVVGAWARLGWDRPVADVANSRGASPDFGDPLLVRPTPLATYPEPAYPSCEDALRAPGWLQQHLPQAWRNRLETSGVTLLVALCVPACQPAAAPSAQVAVASPPPQVAVAATDAAAPQVASPDAPLPVADAAAPSPAPATADVAAPSSVPPNMTPPAAAVVAPLFAHGEGMGATGCVMIAPPVYVSEEEALAILKEELGKLGIALGAPPSQLAALRIPGTGVRNGASARRSIDAADPAHGLAISYVSAEDAQAAAPRSMSSVQSFSTKKTAVAVAQQLKHVHGKLYFGVLYDPLAMDNFESAPGKPRATPEETRTHAQQLLRDQVHDLVQWLQRAQRGGG